MPAAAHAKTAPAIPEPREPRSQASVQVREMPSPPILVAWRPFQVLRRRLELRGFRKSLPLLLLLRVFVGDGPAEVQDCFAPSSYACHLLVAPHWISSGISTDRPTHIMAASKMQRSSEGRTCRWRNHRFREVGADAAQPHSVLTQRHSFLHGAHMPQQMPCLPAS